MYEKIIRERLIELRKSGGYTQKDLEEKTGLDRIKIAKIEAEIQKPDVETIGVLAEFYDVSIDYIFGLGKQKKD